jgi:hypothetical protein
MHPQNFQHEYIMIVSCYAGLDFCFKVSFLISNKYLMDAKWINLPPLLLPLPLFFVPLNAPILPYTLYESIVL